MTNLPTYIYVYVISYILVCTNGHVSLQLWLYFLRSKCLSLEMNYAIPLDTMTLDSRKKDSNSVLQFFFYFNGRCEIDKPYKVFLKLFYKIR